MNYSVELSENFKKEAKRLIKKYPSLKQELALLFEELENYPKKGTSLGNNIYKIRLAISSKGKGKTGGARIITHVTVLEEVVLLLSIYNKGEKDSISNKEILDILKNHL